MPGTPCVCPRPIPARQVLPRQARVKASPGRQRYAAEARRIRAAMASRAGALDQAYHADVLLEVANRAPPAARGGSQQLRTAKAGRPGLPVGHSPIGGSELSCQRPGTAPRRLP